MKLPRHAPQTERPNLHDLARRCVCFITLDRRPRRLPCLPIKAQGRRPLISIRGEFDRKAVLPHKPHLGTPGPIRLKQQRCRIATCGLVDLKLMPRPFMGEQRRRRAHRQTVERVRLCADPKPAKVFRLPPAQAPLSSAPNPDLALTAPIGTPPLHRHHKMPRRGAPCRKLMRMTGPYPLRHSPQRINTPLQRNRRRGVRLKILNDKLHNKIKRLNRLIVCHMLLRLRRRNKGQSKNRRGFGHDMASCGIDQQCRKPMPKSANKFLSHRALRTYAPHHPTE